ncbi:MAG: MBOAT family protein [Cyanobacteria bacterium SZAS-4]|nr:MBOAT family protein [Cyanobacteria bacterium SZAS-4]
MLFNSLQFLIFLPTVVVLFWILPPKFRMPMLLVASYIFYASWMPVFLLLILGMSAANWFIGKWLFKAHNKSVIFKCGIAFNLLLLAIFKYANFCYGSFCFMTSGKPDATLNILLPLGISFFTFEFIHYLFEIYRGKEPIDDFVLFALFAAFFPTQIAGPIKRYPDFLAQMQEVRPFKLSYIDEGLPLIITGLAKKVLLADNLSILVTMGFSNPNFYGAPELWLFAYACAFQIYFDFSGYTDIARGASMLFGYHIPINFNMPFIATNMADFWHRWHISLSTWLRDYLFIPLGGSRKGRWRTNFNIFLTMALGGLWHGASWSFVVWGIYHGLALVIHKEFQTFKQSVKVLDKMCATTAFRLFSIWMTFNAVCIGNVFFRIQDIGAAFSVVKKMIFFRPIFTQAEGHQFLILKPDLPVIVPITMTMVAILVLGNLPWSKLNSTGALRRTPVLLRAVYCSVVIVMMLAFMPDTSAPFIYFQF